jgi:hypothetical protein
MRKWWQTLQWDEKMDVQTTLQTSALFVKKSPTELYRTDCEEGAKAATEPARARTSAAIFMVAVCAFAFFALFL